MLTRPLELWRPGVAEERAQALPLRPTELVAAALAKKKNPRLFLEMNQAPAGPKEAHGGGSIAWKSLG